MLAPTQISYLIHAAEYLSTKDANSKRLNSIITDAFFEKFIVKHPLLGIPKVHVSGWATCFDTKTNTRKWYKLASNLERDGRRLCLEFIRKIKSFSKNDEFYLVQFTLKSSGIPKYTIGQLEQNPITGKIALKHRPDLDSTINKCITLKFNVADIPTNIDLSGIEPWLIGGGFSLQQLQQILATRVFLNFSGIFGLTDIDLICQDENQISIIEFKRKYPAHGHRHVFDAPPNSFDSLLESYPKNALEQCTLIDTQNQPGAYGLDESHLKILAHTSGWIKYRNVIWDSKNRSPSQLLTSKLNLLAPATIRHLYLDLTCFHGVTHTPASKSSSFTKRTRAQLLILESKFSLFSIPIDFHPAS
ncbi:hypothetical protein [Pseudomonas sp. Irchel 3F5]|uniref:hypothetical protein n=1 Tax=Pseudomonas sp. Irchel 3F5 TaxID=2009002 RepID=UPI0011408D34|nr:hypothetical protein [Pseudomonas sp. Irchel 3F5]